MKKIAVGDLGEFWYGDYKEPFEQLEGGVPGHPVGVVLKADDGKLLCAYCGKTWHNLGRHSYAHGLTAKTYKQEVGLLQKSALVSERERQRVLADTIRRGAWRNLDGLREAVKSAADPKPHIRGRKHWLWSAEGLNKTGRCYAQVIAVARTIARSGKRVTTTQLAKHGIGPSTISIYFGDIDRLNHLMGHDKRRPNAPRTDEEYLAALRNVAVELGRTPESTDLRRYGLSSAGGYQKRFGSWREACRRAGLVAVRMPVALDDEIAILNAYALHGNTAEICKRLHRGYPNVKGVLSRYGISVLPWRFQGTTRGHTTRLSTDHLRRAEMEKAAEIARRLAEWPEPEGGMSKKANGSPTGY